MSFATTTALLDWINSQKRPPPPKRTLLVMRPTASEAMKEFTLQYNRLIRQKVSSRTAHKLRMAVLRGETAKDLTSRLPTAVREASLIQDSLSGLQLATFAAANWVRRFAEDRHSKGEWVVLEEKKAGVEIADNIEHKVKELFAKIAEKTPSKTVQDAFQVWEIKWRKEAEADLKQAELNNVANVEHLKRSWTRHHNEDASSLSDAKKFMFAAYIAEIEDSRKELTPEQKKVVESVKEWLKTTEEEPPAWRTQGIKSLGPFGIAANLKVDLEVSFPEDFKEKKLPGTFTATGPDAAIKVYQEGLGGAVKGALSPVFPVTIKQSDPTAALIRIPPEAKYFAFAYPVITGQLEVVVEKKSPVDAFLLFGGFVYFDANMKLVRVNGLWVGNQMQLSAPKPLPASVAQELKDAGRFHDITLPQLASAGAKQFAWILPGEFKGSIQAPHGGWCYLYDNEETNNYFSVASAESVMGLTKAFSLRDIKE